MDFYAVLDEVVELVRSRGRVSHRALREQFSLDDERLETLRAELRYAYLESSRPSGSSTSTSPTGTTSSWQCDSGATPDWWSWARWSANHATS